MTKSTHELQMIGLQVNYDPNEEAKVERMKKMIEQSIKEKTSELEALRVLLRAITKNEGKSA